MLYAYHSCAIPRAHPNLCADSEGDYLVGIKSNICVIFNSYNNIMLFFCNFCCNSGVFILKQRVFSSLRRKSEPFTLHESQIIGHHLCGLAYQGRLPLVSLLDTSHGH